MFMIYPYTQKSESAKAVAEALDGKRILRENSTYKEKPADTIINWGASDCPFPKALNADVSGCLDKLKFFERLKGVGCTPKFTTSKLEAAATLDFPIFCRTETKGHDGQGIVVAVTWEQLVDAPLYVEGVKKTTEYRVHMGRLPDGGTTIIGCQKKIHKSAEGYHPDVWCGEGTVFVWTVNGIPVELPLSVQAAVETAFSKFPELTFGAFDVVSSGAGSAVLEINSAPMMTPETAKRYAEFFRNYEVPEVVEALPCASVPAPVAPLAAPATVSLLDEIRGVLDMGLEAPVAAHVIHEKIILRIA